MQYSSTEKHMKPGTPQAVPSKAFIINWIRSMFPELPQSTKIQDFGNGVIYSRILNHFHGNPPSARITWNPKNQYQYSNNLRYVQAALTQLGITIPFNVHKIAKCKFLQNWALINGFYRHFHQQEQQQSIPEDHSISSQSNQNKTKKLSRPPSYSNQQQQVKVNHQGSHNFTHPSFMNSNKEEYTHMNSQMSSLAQSSLQLTSYLKQNVNMHNNSPGKGKWSVGSQMLHNNQNAAIDRIKQILLKGSHDTEKVRQIKMLLGMPLEEEQIIKIEDDDNGVIIYGNHFKPEEHRQQQQQCNKEKLSGKKSKKPFKL